MASSSRSSRSSRLVGLDVARAVALLGMVATHLLASRAFNGEITAVQSLAGGRASALFAVLAGVSLALMTGRQEPVTGRERVSASIGLAVRALLIATLGLVLGGLGSGIAIILTYYGLLFLLGIAFVGLRAPALFALGAVWVVVAPVLSHLVRPSLPVRQFASPDFAQLEQPTRLLSELALTGYYPVVPWLSYLLIGMALGRSDLGKRGVQVALAGFGLALAAGSTLLSAALVADASFLTPTLRTDIAGGMNGTTPTGATGEWLLVVAPHSATPFDLAQTIGSALVVIGLALLLVGLLPSIGERTIAILFGAGTMTLSLYTLHVVMNTEPVWPDDDPSSFDLHVLVLGSIGALYVAVRLRGPLERLISLISGWLSPRAKKKDPVEAP